ncbi:AraC family transcriptional regulator [Cupriavidus basilensis]|uniref:AraC family transcriptional regulator n=1 Tax=Cupriavidus basilensis TaxID=68895 RepID=A0ABT6ASD8_9BURK|nr:AraC family transcriptional regulator [Cupriavidus basilensis]MDF3835503.1 AraC family transcriptional regulator [Cupriavidus basilensis]
MRSTQFRIVRCDMPGVQAVEASTSHVFARHTHEQFGIGVIWQGAHRSRSGRGMVEAGPGDTIMVNPGEVHDGAPIGDAGRSWRMLYFDPAWIARAGHDLSEGRTRLCEFSRPVASDAAVAAGFQALFHLLTTGRGAGMDLQREALLLTLLARVAEPGPVRSEDAAPAAVERARSLIDDDPATPVSLADLARVTGLSRFQVLRAFTSATGLTPHAYLVQRRIHVARGLIAQGRPLAEAAAASGFADQSHMTRIFVRKYGVSPRAYAQAVA